MIILLRPVDGMRAMLLVEGYRVERRQNAVVGQLHRSGMCHAVAVHFTATLPSAFTPSALYIFISDSAEISRVTYTFGCAHMVAHTAIRHTAMLNALLFIIDIGVNIISKAQMYINNLIFFLFLIENNICIIHNIEAEID